MKTCKKPQRDTRQRHIIYDTVMKHCDHPDADSIYLDVHAQDGRISKGTVYRNLKLLADNGGITRVVVSRADRYDSKLERHHHIVCTVCDRVFDAPLEYVPDYDTLVSQKTGFAVQRHRIVVEGICPECRKKSDQEDSMKRGDCPQ